MKKTFIEGKLPFTGITIGYMAALLILSAIPDAMATENPLYLLTLVPPKVQSLAHIAAYGFLAILWTLNLGSHGVPRFQAVVTAGIIALLYGVLMELVQTLVPERYPSLLDCFLNVAGILIATACYVLVSSQGSISWFRLASRRSKL